LSREWAAFPRQLFVRYTGPIPPAIGTLRALKILILYNNKLNGEGLRRTKGK